MAAAPRNTSQEEEEPVDSCRALSVQLLQLQYDLLLASSAVSGINQQVLGEFADRDAWLLSCRESLHHLVEACYTALEQDRQHRRRTTEASFSTMQRGLRQLQAQVSSLMGELRGVASRTEDKDAANSRISCIRDQVKQLQVKRAEVTDSQQLAAVLADVQLLLQRMWQLPEVPLGGESTQVERSRGRSQLAPAPTRHASTSTRTDKLKTSTVKQARRLHKQSSGTISADSVIDDNSHNADKMPVEHLWTYVSDMSECPGKVDLTDIKYSACSKYVFAVNNRLRQLFWLDRATGHRVSRCKFEHGIPLYSRVDMRPFAMTSTEAGLLYVSDKKGSCVQCLQLTGGGGGEEGGEQLRLRGTLAHTRCHKPRGLAMTHREQLAVVDKMYGRVVLVDTYTGAVASTLDVAKVVAERVSVNSYPNLVYAAHDPLYGRLFLSDVSMRRVHVMDPRSGEYLSSVGGSGGGVGRAGWLHEPQGICVEPWSGQLVVADLVWHSVAETGRLALFSPDGRFVQSFTAQDFHPRAVDVCATGGQSELVVANSVKGTVSRFYLHRQQGSWTTHL